MAEGSEIGKAIYEVLVEIAEREKKEALQNGDYEDALIATIFKGLLKKAERACVTHVQTNNS